MKFHISRQMIYILALAISLLIFVFIFAFAVLIPNGKEYRIARMEAKKIMFRVDAIENEHNKVYKNLKTLQADNRHIITAYKNRFNPERFKKMYGSYFKSLSLSKVSNPLQNGNFASYEVNASTLIHSPQGFYSFLDAINKSDNIIAVNFPIHFKRDNNLIKSSFTMLVYIAEKNPAKKIKSNGSSK